MTIKDIAKEAGVSAAAVSRYFNGGSLGKEKQNKIREIVGKYNYVPNQTAQSMRTGKSGQIGVIVPKIHSDSLSQIMHGIADELEKMDYTMILGCAEGKTEREVNYIETMQKNRMEGIILMGTVMTPYLKDAIDHCKIPLVVTGQSFDGVPCVYYDDFNAMKDIAALVFKKRKKVAYIGVMDEDVAVGKNRRLGVLKAAEEAGLNPDDIITVESGFNMEESLVVSRELVSSHPEIDGVICATDSIAHGAMLAVKESGKRVPEDVSITGVGNTLADIVSEPQLSTVQLYFEQCGRTAVGLIEDMISGNKKTSVISTIMLGYDIIERGSV